MTNNKELFMKWIQNLYYVQCVMLVAIIITALPFIGTWIGWVNLILSGGALYVLFKLAPVHERYRKAATFMAITFVINVIIRFADIGLLTFIGSVCSLIALYQEYSAHSDMMDGVDDKLARKWHCLFNWQLIGGIVLGFLGAPLTVLLTVAFVVDANFVAAMLVVVIAAFDVIIKIFYLKYLKRMLAAYANYEPQVEEVVTEEI